MYRRRKSPLRTPTILQMEAVECGAASLAIVLGYFGRHISLEELRPVCGVSRDGSDAASLLRVARQYGLIAKGFRRTAQQATSGPTPSIALWRANHFLVIEGAQNERVFLNDPALGRRSMTETEFARNYSGIVLTFERGGDFVTAGHPPRLWARLYSLASGLKAHLGFVCLVGILIAFVSFLAPVVTALFVDGVLIDNKRTWLNPLLFLMGGVCIALAVLGWIKDSALLRLETRTALSQGATFVWKLLRLPIVFFDVRYVGDLIHRITSIERLANTATTQFGSALINASTALLIYGLMALLSPILAAISVAGALVNVAAIRWLQRARMDASMRVQTDQGKLFATTVVGIRSIETLKSTGAEDDFFSKWSGYYARFLNSEQRLGRIDVWLSAVPPSIAIATTALVLTVGGYGVTGGAISIGVLVAYQALFGLATAPVQRLVDASGNAQQIHADLCRLDDVNCCEVDWRHATIEAARPSEELAESGLAMNEVTFGYNPLKDPLLRGLNIHIKPGSWIALAGPSGSGKSTISRLIAGLYKPWNGELRIDGFLLETFARRDLSRIVAMVDQDISIFAGTVRDNICLWNDDIPDEVVLRAAQDAQLTDLLSSRPSGLEHWIEEGGRNLSGGERQRIEIARALAMSPSLLVLDEATSALDPLTEKNVMEALRRRGMTCVVIAHRLSTIRDCDEIIVLDRGRIVERGRHDELIASRGAYANLVAEEAAS